MEAKIDGINTRLDTLNGKVAKHEKELGDRKVLDAQATLHIGQLLTESKERKEEMKSYKNMFIERFFWVGGAIILAVISKIYL